MPRTASDIRSLCRAFTSETVQIIAGIARADETPPGVRVQAIALLWDRGWGKAPTTIAGENGGALRVIVRHIVEGRDTEVPVPTTIEHAPIEAVPQLEQGDET